MDFEHVFKVMEDTNERQFVIATDFKEEINMNNMDKILKDALLVYVTNENGERETFEYTLTRKWFRWKTYATYTIDEFKEKLFALPRDRWEVFYG